METKTMDLGTSLLVPCVQELAKLHNKTGHVPPRYIRSDLEDDKAVLTQDRHGASSVDDQQVPVIDLQRLLSRNDDDDSVNSELSKLHSACVHWGFFQLVNHGVSSLLLENVKKGIQEFFNLPMEEKKKFWQYPGELQGFGQAFVVSEEQKLDWADLFYMVTQPVQVRKPHLFPNLPLPFRDDLDAYSTELKNLATTVLALMAKALKMDAKEMHDLFNDGHQGMRMNYYPPCPLPEKVVGLTPHSDASALSILLQINEVEGLQIVKDGKWVPVKPLPNAFIINVGDMLEVITNGIYPSILHRATVNSQKERLSIATFYAAKYENMVGPAPSLVMEQNPAKFKSLTVEEYFKCRFSLKLDGKSYLDTLRI